MRQDLTKSASFKNRFDRNGDSGIFIICLEKIAEIGDKIMILNFDFSDTFFYNARVRTFVEFEMLTMLAHS